MFPNSLLYHKRWSVKVIIIFRNISCCINYSFLIPAGPHNTYGAIRIGPRPIIDAFSPLRDVDVYKKQQRLSHNSDGSLNSYKQESQGKRAFHLKSTLI